MAVHAANLLSPGLAGETPVFAVTDNPPTTPATLTATLTAPLTAPLTASRYSTPMASVSLDATMRCRVWTDRS